MSQSPALSFLSVGYQLALLVWFWCVVGVLFPHFTGDRSRAFSDPQPSDQTIRAVGGDIRSLGNEPAISKDLCISN